MGKKQRKKSVGCRFQVGGHAELDKGGAAEEPLYSGCPATGNRVCGCAARGWERKQSTFPSKQLKELGCH